MTCEAFQKVTDETLQESHLKFGTTDEAQNFRTQKIEIQKIIEDRISFQKKKQRSSFKITTCERFQMGKNDALQELCQVRQQLGTT